MADISVKESTPKWKFPFKINIENRVDNPPRWLSPVLSLAQILPGQLGCSFGYDGQGHPAYAGGPGMFYRFPDEIMEYWR